MDWNGTLQRGNLENPHLKIEIWGTRVPDRFEGFGRSCGVMCWCWMPQPVSINKDRCLSKEEELITVTA